MQQQNGFLGFGKEKGLGQAYLAGYGSEWQSCVCLSIYTLSSIYLLILFTCFMDIYLPSLLSSFVWPCFAKGSYDVLKPTDAPP